MKKIIRTITKNAREELRVGLDEFTTRAGNTLQMVTARIYYDDGCEYRPGRNGISIKIDLLPPLIEGLQKAEREAWAGRLL